MNDVKWLKLPDNKTEMKSVCAKLAKSGHFLEILSVLVTQRAVNNLGRMHIFDDLFKDMTTSIAVYKDRIHLAKFKTNMRSPYTQLIDFDSLW